MGGDNNPQLLTPNYKYEYSNNALYTFLSEDKTLLNTLNDIIKATTNGYYEIYENKNINEIFNLTYLRHALQYLSIKSMRSKNSDILVPFQESIDQNTRKKLASYLLFNLPTISEFQNTGFIFSGISRDKNNKVQGIVLTQKLDNIYLPTRDLSSQKYKPIDE